MLSRYVPSSFVKNSSVPWLEQELGFPSSRSNITHRVREAIRIKLTKMAEIVPGVALWMILLLMFILSAADRSIERERFWATVRRCRS